MILRKCAGGVVFYGDKVFILKNDKGEWVLPKGVIRDNQLKQNVALTRVSKEAGIDAEILSTAGETSYEFFSVTRRQPVCNRITWYVMRATGPQYRIAFELGFTDGDYYDIEKAIDLTTYSQDKALISVAYEKYVQLREKHDALKT
ncbi:MAG: NUDIX hydrolase [Clostridia bacterium]|nr:NUDIX hydrolase [Clostridia bacterium]